VCLVEIENGALLCWAFAERSKAIIHDPLYLGAIESKCQGLRWACVQDGFHVSFDCIRL